MAPEIIEIESSESTQKSVPSRCNRLAEAKKKAKKDIDSIFDLFPTIDKTYHQLYQDGLSGTRRKFGVKKAGYTNFGHKK